MTIPKARANRIIREVQDINKNRDGLVKDVQLKEEGDLILIRIIGSHFLWKMVRRMVGVLVEVGRGKLAEKDIKYFLEHESPTPAKFTAPPSGLFLESVTYENEKMKKEFGAVINIQTGIRINLIAKSNLVSEKQFYAPKNVKN